MDPSALRRANLRLRGGIDREATWSWETDASGCYVDLARGCRDALGYAPCELIGRTPLDLMPLDEAARLGRTLARITADRRSFSGMLHRSIHRDGHVVVLETAGVPVLDAGGFLRGYRGRDRDVTEHEAAQACRHDPTRYDYLTDLPNRVALRTYLAERLAEPQAAPCVLAIDLDRFAAIERQFGHTAGDAVLGEVARNLAAVARKHRAFAARLCGDEFVLIAGDDLDRGVADHLAADLRACLDRDIRVGGRPVQVCANVGIAWARPNETADSLLAAAEADRFRARIASAPAA